MDSLSLLREFNVKANLEQIKLQGDSLNFGGLYVFPKAAPTAFRSVQKELYPLEVVLYLLQNRTASHAEYLRSANAAKIGTVNVADRKKLLDFLDGKADLQLEAGEVLPAIPAPFAAAPMEIDEPAAKKARIEDSSEAGALSTAKSERQLRNRNTMLLVPHREFKRALDIATKVAGSLRQQLQQAEKAAAAAPQPKSQPSQHPQARSQPPNAAMLIKPSGRFERDTTKDQLTAMAGEAGANVGNLINLYGYAGSTQQQQQQQQQGSGSSQQHQHQKPHHPHQQHHKQPAPGSSSRPSSGHPHASSSSRPTSGSAPKPAAPSKPAAAPAAQKKGGEVPIILVPSGLSAMINMYNAKQLLEDGRFETSAAAQQRGVAKQAQVVINRTASRQGKGVPYHITDRAPEKGSADWNRVVAVIAQGAKWQFKDWPFKGAAEGDLLETFNRVCGFFVHYSDEKVSDVVSNWNVKRLGLHRENRHLDMTVMLDFYRHLDTFLAARKSTLAY